MSHFQNSKTFLGLSDKKEWIFLMWS